MLQLPVWALQDWVRARTAHYDRGFVSEDPRFAQAHITALAPFDPDPSPRSLDLVAQIAAATEPMTVRWAELAQFPNGIIHLRPEPDGALRALTARLVEAFPDHPPYGGAFGPDVDPHLTLDAASAEVTLGSTHELVGDLLPVTTQLTHLQLAWWESGNSHVQHEWSLG